MGDSSPKVIALNELHVNTPLRKGLLVPFIGAAASCLRPLNWKDDNESPGGEHSPLAMGWKTLRGRYETVARALDETERDYLAAIVKANGLDPKDDPMVTPQLVVALPFQLAVVRLGIALARELGEHIAKGSHVASDALGGKIRVRVASEEGILARILDALSALSSVPSGPTKGIMVFNPDVLASRLVTLGCVVVGPNKFTDRAANVLYGANRHEIEDKVASFTELYKRRDPGFSIEELHWIESLVWHTLKLGIPIYPNSQELSFQLTTLPPEPRIPILSLQDSGELLPYDRLVGHVKNVFGDLEARYKDAPLLEVHHAVARALKLMYERKCESWTNVSKRLTVAFTTNYDRELERALEKVDTGYHVVYPVTTSPEPMKRGSSVLWVMKTYYRRKRQKAPDFVILKPEQDTLHVRSHEPETSSVELVGPVVVKLHGSPLDEVDLPEPTMYVDGTVYRKNSDVLWSHFLVLSESSFLDSAIAEEIPRWIEKSTLESSPNDGRRELWFLGYSIADWNVRLRLYRYSVQKGKESVLPASRVAFGRQFEPHRHELLTHIDVQFCEGELRRFASLLSSVVDQEENQ